MSSPTLKNMYYKQDTWFDCKSLDNLGWFYRFLRPMAAILDFLTFMGQILVDFFWSFTRPGSLDPGIHFGLEVKRFL